MAQQMLLKALQEGDAPVRTLAASNLDSWACRHDPRALRHYHNGREEVRTTAHSALADLQLKWVSRCPRPCKLLNSGRGQHQLHTILRLYIYEANAYWMTNTNLLMVEGRNLVDDQVK